MVEMVEEEGKDWAPTNGMLLQYEGDEGEGGGGVGSV